MLRRSQHLVKQKLHNAKTNDEANLKSAYVKASQKVLFATTMSFKVLRQ